MSDLTAAQKIEYIREQVTDRIVEIKTLFRPGVFVTVVVRTPHMPDRDFVMGDDMPGEVIAMLERRKAAAKRASPKTAKTAAQVPTAPGFYWAKWRMADENSTKAEEYNSYLPSNKWEAVHVVTNGVDPKDPEYLMVSVPGVADSQSLENFFWGPGPFVVPD